MDISIVGFWFRDMRQKRSMNIVVDHLSCLESQEFDLTDEINDVSLMRYFFRLGQHYHM